MPICHRKLQWVSQWANVHCTNLQKNGILFYKYFKWEGRTLKTWLRKLQKDNFYWIRDYKSISHWENLKIYLRPSYRKPWIASVTFFITTVFTKQCYFRQWWVLLLLEMAFNFMMLQSESLEHFRISSNIFLLVSHFLRQNTIYGYFPKMGPK